MRQVAIEDIYASVILSFCENLAELGYRPKYDGGTFSQPETCDMWFRYLSPKEQAKVASKLLSIEERDEKRFNKQPKKSVKNRKNK